MVGERGGALVQGVVMCPERVEGGGWCFPDLCGAVAYSLWELVPRYWPSLV